jgi:transcriptional regulator with XRE-family HTH domain
VCFLKFNHKKLKELRLKSGNPTQQEMAEAMGLSSAASYTKKELHGETTTIGQLEKLAKKLERDLSEFFEFTGIEPIFNKFQNPKEVPMEETRRLYKLIDYLQSEVERLSNENKELRTSENPLPGREASTQ